MKIDIDITLDRDTFDINQNQLAELIVNAIKERLYTSTNISTDTIRNLQTKVSFIGDLEEHEKATNELIDLVQENTMEVMGWDKISNIMIGNNIYNNGIEILNYSYYYLVNIFINNQWK